MFVGICEKTRMICGLIQESTSLTGSDIWTGSEGSGERLLLGRRVTAFFKQKLGD